MTDRESTASAALAAAIFEAAQPRQERQAKQIVTECGIRQHQGGDVVDDETADLDGVERCRRRAYGSVRGSDLGDKLALRRMKADAGGICGSQGDD